MVTKAPTLIGNQIVVEVGGVEMAASSSSCLRLFRQEIVCARLMALLRAGSKRADKMAMIAITTSNSTKVNPWQKIRRPFRSQKRDVSWLRMVLS